MAPSGLPTRGHEPAASAPGARGRPLSAGRGQAGLGLGIAIPVLSTVVVQFVPMANVGETTGMNALVRMLGGALGTVKFASARTQL